MLGRQSIFDISKLKNYRRMAENERTLLANVYGILFFIAFFCLIAGLGAVVLEIRYLQNSGVGSWTIYYGMLFFLLAIFVKQQSKLALIITILVFISDGIWQVFLAIKYHLSIPVTGVFFRIILIIWVSQGFNAIRQLKEGRE